MLDLFIAEMRRRWRQAKNYPMEEIGSTFIYAVIFYGLFLGSHYMAGPTANFGARLPNMVVGYITWLLVVQTFAGVATDLNNEAKMGTLQQLVMSRFGSSQIMLLRSIADVSVSLLTLSVTLIGVCLVTGTKLDLSLYLVLPFALVVTSSIGLGMILGGLVFTLKRMNVLTGVLNFVLLFAIMTPFETLSGPLHWVGMILPASPGVGLLRQMMAGGAAISTSGVAIAAANAAVYLFLGLAFYRAAERRALRTGRIGAF